MEKYLISKQGNQMDSANSRSKFLSEVGQSGSFMRLSEMNENVEDTSYFVGQNKSFSNEHQPKRIKLLPTKSTTNLENPQFVGKTIEKASTSRPKNTTKFTLLPVIGGNTKINNNPKSNSKETTKDDKKLNVRANGHQETKSLRLVTGTVDFVINIHKVFVDTSLLYEVYGKVLKTLKGKHTCERIILMKNSSGPVLAAVFYEIDQSLIDFEMGQNIVCIGRFVARGRFHAFKIRPRDNITPDAAITRFQNICNFTLNKSPKKQDDTK